MAPGRVRAIQYGRQVTSDEASGSTHEAALDDATLDQDATGPAGVVKIPRSLSPSRAGDFQTCPLLYRLRSIDRLPQKPSAAAVRGTLVHQVLESLFDLPAAERVASTAVDILSTAWATMLVTTPEVDVVRGGQSTSEWLDDAAVLVRRYFELEDPRHLEPREREQLVEARLPQGLTLRGYVDRLDVSPGGLTRVVDYKTGKSPREAFEGKALFQMRFYGLVLWRRDGVIPKQLKLLYLKNAQALIEEPDEDRLLATERKVVALWSAIEAAIEAREFPPTPSRLCDWCDFKSLCPAFDGTPPELPPLRIVDTSPHRASDSDGLASSPGINVHPSPSTEAP